MAAAASAVWSCAAEPDEATVSCPTLLGGTAERPLLLGVRAFSAREVFVDATARLSVITNARPERLRWVWSSTSVRFEDAAVHEFTENVWRVSTTTVPPGAPWGEGRLALTTADTECAHWRLRWANAPSGEEPEARVWRAIDDARAADRSAGEDQAERGWRRVADEADEAGIVSLSARARRAAAFMSIRGRRFEGAAQLLRDAARTQANLGEGPWSAQLLYAEALLMQARGELPGAERALDAAITLATRYLMTDDREVYREAQALALLGQSRFEDALAMLATTPLPVCAPCTTTASIAHAQILANRAWIHLSAREVDGTTSLDEIDRWLAEALEWLPAGTMPATRANMFHSRALVAQARGDLTAASWWVEQYRGVPPSAGQYVRPAVDLLDAALAVERGDLERAQALFVDVERSARHEESVGSDVLWRALEGQAQVARVRGQSARAVRLYQDALSALDETARFTWVLGPRAHFLADRSQVVLDALDTFAGAGALEAIVQAIEDDRRRLVDTLIAPAPDDQTRETWDHTLDVLAERRRAHDALLEQERSASRATVGGLRRARLEAGADAERALAEALTAIDRLRPRVPRLPVARIQRSLRAAEAMRLSWRGACENRGERCVREVWLDRGGLRLDRAPSPRPARIFDVRLDGLDPPADDVVRLTLPSQLVAAQRPRPPTGPWMVLVDPDGSLPGARAEGRTLAALLPAVELHEGAEITRATVLDALKHAKVLHYGGHIDVPTRSPWEVTLRLADGDAVRLADLLAARPSVDILVLGSCDGALPIRLANGRSLTLAELLLASGVHTVIAARGRISDRGARAFLERFYREGGAHAPADALRRARQATSRDDDDDLAQAGQAFEVWGAP